MATFTIGAAVCDALRDLPMGPVGGGPRSRAAGGCRRDSVEAGTFEERFFAVPAPGETDRMLRTARMALDAGRRLRRAERAGERVLDAAERALTTLTAGAVRVYEELCALARLNRGRVYPSYDRLADRTGLGRATVARALATLEAIGFLVHRRRFRRVAGKGAGPRYAQMSNAYRPVLPRAVVALLPQWMRPAPPPADHAHASGQMAEDTNGPVDERLDRPTTAPRATSTDGLLARALLRLGAAVDRAERESHGGPQPLPRIFQKEGDVAAWHGGVGRDTALRA